LWAYPMKQRVPTIKILKWVTGESRILFIKKRGVSMTPQF
jgi:hypothetical protein